MNKSPGTSTPTKPVSSFDRSPNQSARSSAIKRIILHYTTSRNLDGVISWFKNRSSSVSAHYVIATDGELVQMVSDSAKAWHTAGNNNDSIGIEICAEEGDKLTGPQTAILTQLLRWLLAEYHLKPDAITAHGFVPGAQTSCPGDLWMSKAELDAWVGKHVVLSSKPSSLGRPYEPCPVPLPSWRADLRRPAVGVDVFELQCALIGLGYLRKPGEGELVGDVFNEHVEDAVRRLQKDHGLEIDGIVGAQTRSAIERLLTHARRPKGEPADSNVLNVPYFSQRDYGGSLAWSICGVTSAAMVLKYWGHNVTPDSILKKHGKAAGQSPPGLEGIFEAHGLKADSTYNGTLDDLRDHTKAGRPCIVHGMFTTSGHILVVCGFDGDEVICNDPAGDWEEFNGDSYSDNPKNGKAVRYSLDAFKKAVADHRGVGGIWFSVAWK